MAKRGWVGGVVCALAIMSASGCGGEFRAESSTSTTSSGGSTPGTGGAPPGTTSSTSSGKPLQCVPGDLATCDPGSYCQKSSLACVSCAEIEKGFTFGAPRKLSVTLPEGGTDPRFLRIGPNNQLLFTYTAATTVLDVGHADPDPEKFLQWTEGKQEPPPINTGGEEAGSFYLPKGELLAGHLSIPDFEVGKSVTLYHSNIQINRQVYAFTGGEKSSDKLPQLLLFPPPGAKSTSNVTASYDAQIPHFFFSASVLTGDPEVLFTTVLDDPPATPAPLTIKLDNNCALKSKGVAPWVTPDGQWLLFGGQQPDANNKCANDDLKARFRLYYTQLDPETGLQPEGATAQEILPDRSMQSSLFPSLSPDRCVLYFSDQKGSGTSATFESYAAVRE